MTSASGTAYLNQEFLLGDAGRPIRILAEYLEPFDRFRRLGIEDTVVFFGSARAGEGGVQARYYREARELARRLTLWTRRELGPGRFVVCTGGGGGIMEAANRGATEAGGLSIGLNIGLPHEQRPNSYVTPELSFEFRYFFMRKMWFAHLARALVAFPGGFGTLDEVMEVLTLVQTRKLARQVPIVLYGRSYWREVVDFEALVRHEAIDESDLTLFQHADDPEEALAILTCCLSGAAAEAGGLARSTTSDHPP